MYPQFQFSNKDSHDATYFEKSPIRHQGLRPDEKICHQTMIVGYNTNGCEALWWLQYKVTGYGKFKDKKYESEEYWNTDCFKKLS